MSLYSVGRQVGSVTRVGIATIPQRLGASAVVIVGIAGVVGVLVGLLAMGEGFENTLMQTGSDDSFIVLSAGSRSEAASTLGTETPAVVSQVAHVQTNAAGRTMLLARKWFAGGPVDRSRRRPVSSDSRGTHADRDRLA